MSIETPQPSSSATPAAARYPGAGTLGDPYIVDWDEYDLENPRDWPRLRRWGLTLLVSNFLRQRGLLHCLYSWVLLLGISLLPLPPTVEVWDIS